MLAGILGAIFVLAAFALARTVKARRTRTTDKAMRDYVRRGSESGRFISIPEDAGVLLTAKPADDGDGIILRLQNLRPDDREVPLEFAAAQPASAHHTSALEVDGDPLEVDGHTIRVPLGARAVQSVRVRLERGGSS